MKRNVGICLGTAFYIATASFAHAHHSYPIFYDQCKTLAIEGRVETVQWKDPHTLIELKADDGMTYHVEWAGLRGLANRGWEGFAREAVVAGTRLAVTGNPGRDAAEIRAHFPDLKIDPTRKTVAPRVIRRVDNSWSWAPSQNANPPNCVGK